MDHTQRLPFSIWALSLSTFFLNLASTIVFVSMPLFLQAYFGATGSQAGALEGIGEGLSLLARAAIGIASDFSRKRKGYLLVGYAISLVARLFLAMGYAFSSVIAGRFLDKVGNGVQASPREAYISDVTPKDLLGKAYGLNKALGMMGSLSASVILIVCCAYMTINLRFLFYISVFLTAVSIGCLIWGVRDASHATLSEEGVAAASLRERLLSVCRDIALFPWSYWIAIIVVFLFKLGYFSGAFLMVWLDQQGFENFFGLMLRGNPALTGSVVMVLQNFFCAVLAYPMGALSDRVDRRIVAAIGMVCMLISLAFLGMGAGSTWLMMLGVVFYGIQMSMQGALMALLSMTMPGKLKGTGFGIFFLTSGLGVIIANQCLMKGLWDAYGARMAFLSITIPVTLALVLLPCIRLKAPPKIS